jgi:hypothetical protein
MIDFRVPGQWEEINARLETSLNWKGPGHLKLFFGTAAALLEIITSLQKQFPLRRKVYFCKSLDPLVDSVVTHLAREGLALQPLTMAEWTDNAWISKVDKEGLAVILPMDDPFLGKLYARPDLQPALAPTKLFQICISHSQHRSRGIPALTHPLQIHLLSLTDSLCLGAFAEKAKVPLWFSETFPWHLEMLETAVDVLEEPQENKETVLKFEAAKMAGCEPFFPPEADRLWDRAVIYWKDMDGFAFIEELSDRIGFGLMPPGEEQTMETTSLTRWGGLRTMDWLQASGIEADVIRGMVVLSASVLKLHNFETAFKGAREHILKLQTGESAQL